VGLVSSNGRALSTTSIAAAVLLIASAIVLTASYRPNRAVANV
jgi:hypothetical protein